MKILIMSDIHYEFHKDGGVSFLNSIKSEPDVCVIAGDLCSSKELKRSIKLVSERFAQVVYVHGNHEAYDSSIPWMKESINKHKPDNFHFLDNSSVEIQGQRFIGNCLWFRYNTWNILDQKYMTDFHVIRNAHEIYEENAKSIKFLENNVNPADIVVTHHLPSERSIHPRYKNSNLNKFFLCDMEPLIEAEQPLIWIHGHTHESCDYNLGVTRVICNPFGYAGIELNKEFEEKVIEI